MSRSRWGIAMHEVPAESVVVLVNGGLFITEKLTRDSRARWVKFATQKEKTHPALWKIQVWETHAVTAKRAY